MDKKQGIHIFLVLVCSLAILLLLFDLQDDSSAMIKIIILSIVCFRSIKFLTTGVYGPEPVKEDKEQKENKEQKASIKLNDMELNPDNVRKLYQSGYESLAFRQFCKLPGHKQYSREQLKEMFYQLMK